MESSIALGKSILSALMRRGRPWPRVIVRTSAMCRALCVLLSERVRATDKEAYVKSLTVKGETLLLCGGGKNDTLECAQAVIRVHLYTGECATCDCESNG